jgi:uncharacterized protein YutE (UPF0331/DUF86 family)
MEEKLLNDLIKLREFVISRYDKLDGRTESSAMMKQDEVAFDFETIVRSIDDLLKNDVKFE